MIAIIIIVISTNGAILPYNFLKGHLFLVVTVKTRDNKESVGWIVTSYNH